MKYYRHCETNDRSIGYEVTRLTSSSKDLILSQKNSVHILTHIFLNSFQYHLTVTTLNTMLHRTECDALCWTTVRNVNEECL
jgi:hypothetical protein